MAAANTDTENQTLTAGEPSPTEKPTAGGAASQEDTDEESSLRFLAAGVRDQDDLERDIGRQADQMLTEQADERDNKRIEKTQQTKQRLLTQLANLEERLRGPGGSSIKNKVRADIAENKSKISQLDEELEQIQQRIEERHAVEADEAAKDGSGQTKRLANESRRDFLIRTGKITPFSRMAQTTHRIASNLEDAMLDAENEDEGQEEEEESLLRAAEAPRSHINLLKPGFASDASSDAGTESDVASDRPTKRRRTGATIATSPQSLGTVPEDGSDAEFDPKMNDRELAGIGGSEDSDEDSGFRMDTTPPRKTQRSRKRIRETDSEERQDLAGKDDGNEQVYKSRLQSWVKRRAEARRKAKAKIQARDGDEDEEVDDTVEAVAEWYQPHPSRSDTTFTDGFKIPGDIYPSLFDYQKTGVQWLWELYTQQVGGIIGDEMGLGKTIQIVSFLAGLHYSGKLDKPVIVVCPATVMEQWVNEFHQWWPPLRVSILHTSGSGMMDVKKERQMEYALETREYSESSRKLSKSQKAAKRIVDQVVQKGHVLVTTYSGLQTYAEYLIPTDWAYAVLDEGHKIRNPNTSITIHCKELRTPNRVILSGTPMQNNLTELWSLFDFVFPMRLGTLVSFRTQFEFPIKQGGYANASNLQVQTAVQCAETLKATISPYLLQRFKVDVAADLPKKSERVLFCRLTMLQRKAYEFFLNSDDMKSIMEGKRNALFGVDILRKNCNHPDLVEHKTLSIRPGYNYGDPKKSGKMQVVKALLEIWRKNGHKTLLFAQHRIMLDILEKFVQGQDGLNYRRMDGSTDIKHRQHMVDEFNRDPDIHLFLLTTKVGGLGVNLTGADRVIIYDPDWNPSTDMQARERAWRLGQKREVEIYRLMTAGTIEEKIYHRQIFKQFLSNKILKDPKQRQTFNLSDLHDLFTLGGAADDQTETSNIFKGSEVKWSDKGIENTSQQNGKAPETFSNIKGISREEDYAPEAEETPADAPSPSKDPSSSKDTSEANPDAKKSDRLLSTIFSRADIHSATDHEAVLSSRTGGKPKVTADPEMIRREAKRVADKAAKELQRAGETARSVPAGTPTWTGLYGSAGRPEERRPGLGAGRGRGSGAGPSSRGVLANLAQRQGNALGGPSGSGSASGSGASTPRRGTPQANGRNVIQQIRDFFVTHGGACYTKMLVDHFDSLCRGSGYSPEEFKAMLQRVAVLDKARHGQGRGRWILKEEFGGRG